MGNNRRGARIQKGNMKRILLFIIVALAAITVEAQTNTFVEAGLSGSYGSNEKRVSFPELYGVAGFKLFEFNGATVQLRARGRYSKTPDYADLFTRDDNPERRATGELILAPTARLNFSKETFFKPFVDAGVEYRRQFGLSGAPYSGLNPTFTVGTRAGYGYEVFYTRLFEDRFGRSRLRGDRLGLSYSLKLASSFHFKFGAEGERVSYRACSNVDCDGYREYDWLARPFVAISIY